MLTLTSYLRPALLVLVPLIVGVVARRLGKLEKIFKGIYALVLWIILPVLVFGSVAIQRPDQMYSLGSPVALALIGLGAIAVLSAVLTRLMKFDKEKSVSVFLNASFMNYTFLGLAVVYTIVGILPGEATGVSGLGIASIYAVAMGVIHLTIGLALAASSSKSKIDLRSITLSILTFPAAFALIVAMLFVGFDMGFPIVVQSWVDQFADVSVFIMLLVAGYHMPIVDPRKYLPTITLVGFLRLLVCPLVTYGAIVLFNVGEVIATTTLLLSAMPPGVFNIILAKKYDLDQELYGATIFYLTIISLFVSVPIIVHFFVPGISLI
ncbi:MAG: AEC family transporter [Hadesarchaea archaeon]|nr:AEC family transporter [Hadesarchaea archaeon]